MASREENLSIDGTVEEAFMGIMSTTRLDNDNSLNGLHSGNIRRYSIRLLFGDPVNLAPSQLNKDRGRILFHYRSEQRMSVRQPGYSSLNY